MIGENSSLDDGSNALRVLESLRSHFDDARTLFAVTEAIVDDARFRDDHVDGVLEDLIYALLKVRECRGRLNDKPARSGLLDIADRATLLVREVDPARPER